MCIYQIIAHNRAIRPFHPSHSMPLALILPRGDQRYELRKPLIRRDSGDTLNSLYLLYSSSLSPENLVLPPPASLLLSRLSGLAATEPTLYFLHFFSLSTRVSPVSRTTSTTILRFLALFRLSCALPVCVCVFIKLHITAQSGPGILVILCPSH